MTISVYDPGRDHMRASIDRLISQEIAAERVPDRQFGPIGGLVIAAAASLPLWWLIVFVIGLLIGWRLP